MYNFCVHLILAMRRGIEQDNMHVKIWSLTILNIYYFERVLTLEGREARLARRHSCSAEPVVLRTSQVDTRCRD